jgi:hypothetical protein
MIDKYPSEDPDWRYLDPANIAAVEKWQANTARSYSQWLQYFETPRVDMSEASDSGRAWVRMFGANLPRDVLEKFYHGNAERLIRGIALQSAK